jgi:hypothetical protein
VFSVVRNDPYIGRLLAFWDVPFKDEAAGVGALDQVCGFVFAGGRVVLTLSSQKGILSKS